MNDLQTPFYLTGGTALSRHYLNHRYSEDLDLFVNDDPDYGDYVQNIFQELENTAKKKRFKFDHQKTIRGKDYTSLTLIAEKNVFLTIDLINDVADRFGELSSSPTLGKVDHWRNILSNKLTALYRLEPKDFVDLWAISKRFSYDWKDIFQEAKQKEAALDPVTIVDLIKSAPADVFESIKWVHPVDSNELLSELHIIANDIFLGNVNSLMKT